MQEHELKLLGFEWQPITNRINLKHKKRFIVNDITTMVVYDGYWIRTFDVETKEQALQLVKTIAFVDR